MKWFYESVLSANRTQKFEKIIFDSRKYSEPGNILMRSWRKDLNISGALKHPWSETLAK